MLRETTVGIVTTMPATSKWLIEGTRTMTGELVVMTLPAVEQIGQKCESMVLELSSRQQCICAARKTIPRSKTTK